MLVREADIRHVDAGQILRINAFDLIEVLEQLLGRLLQRDVGVGCKCDLIGDVLNRRRIALRAYGYCKNLLSRCRIAAVCLIRRSGDRQLKVGVIVRRRCNLQIGQVFRRQRPVACLGIERAVVEGRALRHPGYLDRQAL